MPSVQYRSAQDLRWLSRRQRPLRLQVSATPCRLGKLDVPRHAMEFEPALCRRSLLHDVVYTVEITRLCFKPKRNRIGTTGCSRGNRPGSKSLQSESRTWPLDL